MSILAEKIKSLPQSPGVYFFYAADKQLLYIGKATNLRSRVQSYFRSEHNRGQWIDRMIEQISDIAFEQTDSVLEALILESNLIKKHLPKYNTLEKDDKSFSYFGVTKEEFPRVLIYRRTDLDIEKKEVLKKNKVLKNPQPNSYKLQAIFGPYTSKMQMQIALKIIRRIFPFHALKQQSEKGCLDFQMGKCPGPYAGAISKDDYKKNIRGIRMILEGKKKSLLSKLEKEMHAASKKHEFEKAGDIKNKIYALQHIRDVALMTRDFENNMQHGTWNLDQEAPDAKYQASGTFRVEAYDISNISGDHAVGSMVVFENGLPNKSQYRKFKIKTITESNDVGMMREVLLRRFKNDWAMPDLVLLDGGLGHLNMGEDLLHKELGLAVNIAAVAKGPTRKKLDIRLDTNLKEKISKEIVNIIENDNLIKSIMDEAHRFAIAFHRHRRKKGMMD